MALFSKGSSAPEGLTRERIEAALGANGWKYTVDEDGDIGGLWENSIFFFLRGGEQRHILLIRGRWDSYQPIDRRAQIRELLDEWHDSKIWPKGFTNVDDEGRLWVLAEHSLDCEHGVTDEQLNLVIKSTLKASVTMFQFLGERL